jgi:hypothetical protein
LIDKKGQKVYPGQPIAKWMKRKELLMKRMKKVK